MRRAPPAGRKVLEKGMFAIETCVIKGIGAIAIGWLRRGGGYGCPAFAAKSMSALT
jgi:hypothetical protein